MAYYIILDVVYPSYAIGIRGAVHSLCLCLWIHSWSCWFWCTVRSRTRWWLSSKSNSGWSALQQSIGKMVSGYILIPFCWTLLRLNGEKYQPYPVHCKHGKYHSTSSSQAQYLKLTNTAYCMSTMSACTKQVYIVVPCLGVRTIKLALDLEVGPYKFM